MFWNLKIYVCIINFRWFLAHSLYDSGCVSYRRTRGAQILSVMLYWKVMSIKVLEEAQVMCVTHWVLNRWKASLWNALCGYVFCVCCFPVICVILSSLCGMSTGLGKMTVWMVEDYCHLWCSALPVLPHAKYVMLQSVMQFSACVTSHVMCIVSQSVMQFFACVTSHVMYIVSQSVIQFSACVTSHVMYIVSQSVMQFSACVTSHVMYIVSQSVIQFFACVTSHVMYTVS
jgi:hypothetical protein